MPGDVDVVPVEELELGREHHDRAENGHHGGIHAVQLVRRPDDENEHEDDEGLDFVELHGTELPIGLAEGFGAARKLGLTILGRNRKDEAHADGIGDEAEGEHERQAGHEPVEVKNLDARACKKGHAEKVSARSRHERVAARIDHQEVVQHEVAGEIVGRVRSRRAVDRGDHHEERASSARPSRPLR